MLAAPQEVTMRSGGQVVEEADRGAIYAQGRGTQRRKQGKKPCGDHAIFEDLDVDFKSS